MHNNGRYEREAMESLHKTIFTYIKNPRTKLEWVQLAYYIVTDEVLVDRIKWDQLYVVIRGFNKAPLENFSLSDLNDLEKHSYKMMCGVGSRQQAKMMRSFRKRLLRECECKRDRIAIRQKKGKFVCA